MAIREKPVAAFVLSLAAGVFILLGAVVMSMFVFGAWNMMNGMMNMGGMMCMFCMPSIASVLSVIGLVSGGLVLVGSVMIYRSPGASQLWGAIVLVFSVASIMGAMAGFMVGLVLGVVGGVLAMTWKLDSGPTSQKK